MVGLKFLDYPLEVVCMLLIVRLSHFKGLKGHVLGITAAPRETSGMIRWGCDSAMRIQKVVEKIHFD